MGLLDAFKKKIADWRRAPQTIPQRVAPQAQAMLRDSSRTARGNRLTISSGFHSLLIFWNSSQRFK